MLDGLRLLALLVGWLPFVGIIFSGPVLILGLLGLFQARSVVILGRGRAAMFVVFGAITLAFSILSGIAISHVTGTLF